LIPRGRPRKAVSWAGRRALVQQPSRQARRYGVGSSELVRDSRLIELERKVGQQAVEIDFFKEALRHVKEPPPASGGRGGRASSRSSTRLCLPQALSPSSGCARSWGSARRALFCTCRPLPRRLC